MLRRIRSKLNKFGGIMKKVAYLGPKGSFSQEAFDLCYNGKNVEAVEYMNMNDAIMSVVKDETDEAIVPIENSIEGSVNTTLDAVYSVDLNIIKEIVIPISLNIMVKKGVKKDEIKSIMTHPQPIGQAREYINKNFSKASIVYTYSTSEGAKLVVEGDGTEATIGSKKAAEIYGLDVIEANVQDNNNNQTRFIVLSKKTAPKSGNDKTSIIFSGEDKPGSLYRILDIFSLWDVNLTKIESRPSKNGLGQYIFFVDLEGHVDNEDVKDALTMIKKKTSFYKFLGSYPKYN